ncbi:MAG: hypothetical protein JETT_0933 [Candidatus Jettenia ecosi]|uniref:Uncharacterized protein n=1 Tax=Candidatus Jettenia ecosi TaxID=2494326 RepID=A0A533QE18_9BACT|nr:MAG: hypothetical protein JETT_0933 [Candidatus Jettenia ecosi]
MIVYGSEKVWYFRKDKDSKSSRQEGHKKETNKEIMNF